MIGALLSLVIYLIVVGLILWVLLYLVQNIPLPAPYAQVARVVIMVLGALILIVLLLNFAGIMDVGVRPLVR